MSYELRLHMRENALMGIVMSLVVTVFIGCAGGISKESLIGHYRLAGKAGTIDLELAADGAFVQTVRFEDGTRSVRRGRWVPPSSANSTVGLDGLWIPREFCPGYLNEADTRKDGHPKCSDPGYWVGKPYRALGKIVLPMFPDENMNFERVTSGIDR